MKKICNIGINDLGFSSDKNNKNLKSYQLWMDVIRRCCHINELRRHPSYVGCSVCAEWEFFSNFKRWFDENYNPDIMQGWHLDKDILIKGNKEYSPETCCFIPREINFIYTKRHNDRGNLLIGVVLEKYTNLYRSQISEYGKRRTIGRYKTEEEAFCSYKDAKEQYVKNVAEKWKGKIADNVYQAMRSYKVEITD